MNHQVDYAGDTSDPGSALTLRGLTEPLGGPMSTDATSVVKPAQQLYRLFDADGELLYIGISYSALARIGQHKASQPWWHEVVSIDIESFQWASRRTIREVEREAIIRERPKYNVMHAKSTRPMDKFDWIAHWRRAGRKCKVCGLPSIYDYHNDRFFHEDGSDNQPCWFAILRGDVRAPW